MQNSRAHSILLIDERSLTLECANSGLWAGSHDFDISALGGIDEVRKALETGARPELIILSCGRVRVAERYVQDGIRRLLAIAPGVPVVVLSDLDDSGEVAEAREAFRLGARGYIRSSMTLDLVIAALRLVLAGGTFVPESVLGRNGLDGIPDRDTRNVGKLLDLTPREMEVLIRLHEGKPNKIIARELALSVGTVQVYVRRILQKLHATSRSQIAYIVSRLQLILLSQLARSDATWGSLT